MRPWPTRGRSNWIASAASTAPAGTGPAKWMCSSRSPQSRNASTSTASGSSSAVSRKAEKAPGTSRYNRDYWISVDGLTKHYERADVDAQRTAGSSYEITTRNVTRLVLRETEHAKQIKIDGQSVKVKSAPTLTLARNGTTWKVDK